jgi:broad specificity phosphatase PhoE
MQITITFIRHAPTNANRSGIFMGIQDISCDIRELTKSKLQFVNIERNTLYSSPLKRAVVSAEYLFPNTPIIIDNRLIEKNLGEWEGQSKGYLINKFPEAFLESGHLNPFFVPDKGESFDELKNRLKSFLKDIIVKYKDSFENKRIFVVTHNGVIRTMRCIIENIEPLDFFKTSESFLTPIDFIFELYKWNHILKIK